MTRKSTILGTATVAALMFGTPLFAAATSTPQQTQATPATPPPYNVAQPGDKMQPTDQSAPAGASMSSSASTSASSPVTLSHVQNPSQALVSAQVQDSSGQTVGQVQTVETTSGGNVARV
jgi:hypothetical protein